MHSRTPGFSLFHLGSPPSDCNPSTSRLTWPVAAGTVATCIAMAEFTHVTQPVMGLRFTMRFVLAGWKRAAAPLRGPLTLCR